MARANGTAVKRKISVESSRPGKKRKAIGGQQAASGSGRPRHGGSVASGPTQGKKARAAKGPQDYFEADDSDPDEIKHSDRYDDVENYEYEMPSDFEDEEIDEEGAFTKEDEKKYGAWFEREAGAGEDGDDDFDDDDDVGSEGTDAGEDDEDDGNLVNDDADGRRPGRTARQALPGDEDDGGEGDDDDGLGFDDEEDDDDDIGLDLGDDDDGDDEDGGGGERHRQMISAVLGDAADKKKKGKKAAVQVVSEAYPESEFNINAGAASAGERSGGLSVADLMAGLGDRRRKLTGSARRLLDQVAGGRTAPVSAPLPRIIKERQERKAGYEEAKKEVTKWQPIVKANREAPSLVFTSAKHEVPQTNTTASIVARFEPRTADAPADAATKQQQKAGETAADTPGGAEATGAHAGAAGDDDDDDDIGMGMEAEVAALLSRAGALSAKAVQEAEEKLALKSLTIEEVRERRERLAKLRALLFYSELKAKRMKAIKSKDFHRHLARAAKRKALKSGAADGADEAARQAAEEAEFDRARERLTLRHRNTSKWARRALKRGANITDDGTREALDEQLRLGQQLRRKMEGRKARDGSDDDSDASTSASDGEGDGSDGEEGGEGRGQLLGSSKARAAALDVLSGGDLPEDAPKKGLFALPFMARALEKKRQAAQLEAQQLLRELEEQEAADGTAAAGDDALGGSGAAAGAASAGRRVFGGAGAAPSGVGYSAVDVDDLDGDGSGSDDDREDTEAKAERLAKLRSEAAKLAPAGAKQQQQPAASRRGHTGPAAAAAAAAAGATFDAEDDDGAGRAAAALLATCSSEAALDLTAAVQRRRAPAGAAGRADAASGASGAAAAAGLAPFVKCGKFEGARPGYIFKKGPKGVGYYLDSKQQPQQGVAARPTVVVAGTASASTAAAATHSAAAKGKAAAAGKQTVGSTAAPAPSGATAGAQKKHRNDDDDDGDDDLAGAEADADQDRDAAGGAPAGHMRPAPAGRDAQMDLIRQAFAGDDVEAEFAAEKAQAITGELPDLPEPTALPGWGAWGVQQRSAKWVAQEREKINKVKAAAAASRKDASLKYVIVSETWDKKAAKYHAQQVPFPFDSAAVYEQSLRQPLGRQYNPDSAFRDMTRPAVVKTTGVVIEPARFAKAVAQHAQKVTAGKAGTGAGRGLAAKAKAEAAGPGTRGARPKVLTVAGGINKR